MVIGLDEGHHRTDRRVQLVHVRGDILDMYRVHRVERVDGRVY